jgi:hypothetical protein
MILEEDYAENIINDWMDLWLPIGKLSMSVFHIYHLICTSIR